MPIKSAPYYFAVCDKCGERADYDEFTAYEDAGHAADEAIAGDWTEKGDVWHCPDCPPLDEEESAGEVDA
jgi:hypothetical protein